MPASHAWQAYELTGRKCPVRSGRGCDLLLDCLCRLRDEAAVPGLAEIDLRRLQLVVELLQEFHTKARELVEKKRWMTREQFVEDWAVAQILPGPNVVNLSMMIGDRYFGLRGALVALAGMLAAPLVVVLMLALVYAQFAGNPQVAGALRGMGAVAAGLIAATGLKLFGALRKHPLGVAPCVVLGGLCFAAVALLRLPLAWALFSLGGLACALTWRKLAP
mgnify:CR=1 FL=1